VLGDAQEGVNRVIGIVTDLRSFTRGDTTMMTELTLADVVESSRRLVSSALSGVAFNTEIEDSLMVEGNEGQLCQLFVNFFQNSTRAIQLNKTRAEQGQIDVRAEMTRQGVVCLSIRDNGCGINQEDMEKIFDPFFTKNDVGEGMGLGLSICHRILEQHNAEIRVASKEGEFTEFSILFGDSA